MSYGIIGENLEEMLQRGHKRAPRQVEIPDPAEWARKRLGFTPDAVQRKVLLSTSRYGILNCSRQWGKSTTVAAKAVYEAVHRQGSLIVVVSPTGRQSGEFVRKAAHFLGKLGVPRTGDRTNDISLALPNGSRIVGLPATEDTTRGFSSVTLLLMDEASRMNDQMYLAIRPMLAVSQGALWLMSTPFGKRGFFWDVWEKGGPEWERIQVTAEECPRISKEFLEQERRAMGARWFNQEYMCEFVQTEDFVFDRDLVEAAVTDDIEPLEID